jgi:hypothetical protein
MLPVGGDLTQALGAALGLANVLAEHAAAIRTLDGALDQPLALARRQLDQRIHLSRVIERRPFDFVECLSAKFGRAVNVASDRLRRHPCFCCGTAGEAAPSVVRELVERLQSNLFELVPGSAGDD